MRENPFSFVYKANNNLFSTFSFTLSINPSSPPQKKAAQQKINQQQLVMATMESEIVRLRGKLIESKGTKFCLKDFMTKRIFLFKNI